jgi:hypothetical protein
MGCLEGSGVPVLYIGRTVPKGYPLVIRNSAGTEEHPDDDTHTRFEIFGSGRIEE